MNGQGTSEHRERAEAVVADSFEVGSSDQNSAEVAVVVTAQGSSPHADAAGHALRMKRDGNQLASEGRFREAQRQYEEALAIYLAEGESADSFDVSNNLALMQVESGAATDAIVAFELLTEQARNAGDRARQACALHNLAWIHKRLGNFERSEALYREALACLGAIDWPAFESNVRNNLGSLARIRGQLETAEELIRDALELAHSVGDEEAIASRLNNLALVQRDQGRFDEALASLEESLAFARTLENPRMEAQRLVNMAVIVRIQGDLRVARDYLDRAAELHERCDDSSGRALMLRRRGSVCLAQGQLESAREQLEQALGLLELLAQAAEIPLVRYELAKVRLAQGEVLMAERMAQQAIAELAMFDRPDEELAAWLVLVECELNRISVAGSDNIASGPPPSIGIAIDRARALAATYPDTGRRARVELMAARYFRTRGHASAAQALAEAVQAEAEAAGLTEVVMETRMLLGQILCDSASRNERAVGRRELASLVRDARIRGYFRLAESAAIEGDRA